ncbi:sialin-like, partial [Hyposmocoma kahamanoa]|uniref:sialin-like n=1 Tax=Hyposmocoma kahamanoa TaxID=1477025 RepID=UPI000E6D93A5
MASGKDEYTSVPQTVSLEQNKAPLDLCPPPKGFGARHMQALILFISLTVGYGMRSHLSVTLVAMTGNATNCYQIELSHDNVTVGNFSNVFSLPENTDLCKGSLKTWSVYRTYNWNKPTQEMILFSFVVGYTSMMIPMGVIAQKLGGKIPIMMALGVNGVLSILTPWMAVFGGWLATCACRLLQGMTQAAFYPSIHTILGKWAPLSERGRLSTYIYT